METIMKETGRLFPVYTYHVSELIRCREAANRILDKHRFEEGTERIAAVKRLRQRFEEVILLMTECGGEIAYLNERDTALVRKAADWLARHPEQAGAGNTDEQTA